MLLVFGCLGLCGCRAHRRGNRTRLVGENDEVEDLLDILGAIGTSRLSRRGNIVLFECSQRKGPRSIRLDKLLVRKFTPNDILGDSSSPQVKDDLVHVASEDAK